MIADLGGLGSVAARAPWTRSSRCSRRASSGSACRSIRSEGGAVHVGALDAMAGLPFRVVAIPGLVEGGYPGVLRPDPFLLDRSARRCESVGGPRGRLRRTRRSALSARAAPASPWPRRRPSPASASPLR